TFSPSPFCSAPSIIPKPRPRAPPSSLLALKPTSSCRLAPMSAMREMERARGASHTSLACAAAALLTYPFARRPLKRRCLPRRHCLAVLRRLGYAPSSGSVLRARAMPASITPDSSLTHCPRRRRYSTSFPPSLLFSLPLLPFPFPPVEWTLTPQINLQAFRLASGRRTMRETGPANVRRTCLTCAVSAKSRYPLARRLLPDQPTRSTMPQRARNRSLSSLAPSLSFTAAPASTQRRRPYAYVRVGSRARVGLSEGGSEREIRYDDKYFVFVLYRNTSLMPQVNLPPFILSVNCLSSVFPLSPSARLPFLHFSGSLLPGLRFLLLS
ncbi:hypothetical protein B0H14DRAFT_3595720, partial [Mycena olivaceomarginata]